MLIAKKRHMGLTYVTAVLKALGGRKKYQATFLVDTGATDTMVPASELRKIGVKPIGKMAYELADGSLKEYEFGLAEITFMGSVTAGRILFGPDGAEPLLGVIMLESVGIAVDPKNEKLTRLPSMKLKAMPRDLIA
jgi:clan AA aspartic protease